MRPLGSGDRKRLRGLAHALEPIVRVGKRGVTPDLEASLEEALLAHELVKVRFLERKDERKELTEAMARAVGAEVAGLVGHVAILYREHPDPEKRRIDLEESASRK